jgi:hypothetical protein
MGCVKIGKFLNQNGEQCTIRKPYNLSGFVIFLCRSKYRLLYVEILQDLNASLSTFRTVFVFVTSKLSWSPASKAIFLIHLSLLSFPYTGSTHETGDAGDSAGRSPRRRRSAACSLHRRVPPCPYRPIRAGLACPRRHRPPLPAPPGNGSRAGDPSLEPGAPLPHRALPPGTSSLFQATHSLPTFLPRPHIPPRSRPGRRRRFLRRRRRLDPSPTPSTPSGTSWWTVPCR